MVKAKVAGLGQQDGMGSTADHGSTHERQIQEMEQSRGRPDKTVEHQPRSSSSGQKGHDEPAAYTVTITSTTGEEDTYRCGGHTDQDALVFAGKVVQANADASGPDAAVRIRRDGQAIGPIVTVADMIGRIV